MQLYGDSLASGDIIDDVAAQWATAVRLAQANGASLRDIAEVAKASPQTISKVCKD